MKFECFAGLLCNKCCSRKQLKRVLWILVGIKQTINFLRKRKIPPSHALRTMSNRIIIIYHVQQASFEEKSLQLGLRVRTQRASNGMGIPRNET